MKAARWSDNERYFGPFTYAREGARGYRPFAFVLRSMGDDDDYNGGNVCTLRIAGFGHTLIATLPPVIRPWKRKVTHGWDAETVARLGRNWYYDVYPREYGFSVSEGFLQVFLGAQTHDSETTQSWSKFLPWTQWRFVRFSIYDLTGAHYWTEPQRKRGDGFKGFEARRKAEECVGKQTFAFKDFDGEELSATAFISEHEWLFGEGWFKWLSLFRKPKVRRSLDITFSGETGKRKGSWKGGTIGHSIDMHAGELHEAAFRRYCQEHAMTFLPTPPSEKEK